MAQRASALGAYQRGYEIMKRLVALAPDNAAFNRAHHPRQTSLIGELSPAPGRSLPGPLYASHRVSRDQSRLWRADAVRERLGTRLGQHFEIGEDFPPRSKRMRWTTYRRLEAKYEHAQARWLTGITGFIDKLGGRLGSQ
jgi:hypothetical protein